MSDLRMKHQVCQSRMLQDLFQRVQRPRYGGRSRAAISTARSIRFPAPADHLDDFSPLRASDTHFEEHLATHLRCPPRPLANDLGQRPLHTPPFRFPDGTARLPPKRHGVKHRRGDVAIAGGIPNRAAKMSLSSRFSRSDCSTSSVSFPTSSA